MAATKQALPADLKAKVIAAVQMGESKSAVARRFNVSRAAVQMWTRALQPMAVIIPEKQDDIDALYTDFVSETLLALRQLARRSQTEDWLHTLPAREAYLWFGTLADKALAALSAYESASERLESDGVHTP